MVGGSVVPQPHQLFGLPIPVSIGGPAPARLIITAASLHLGHFLQNRFIIPHLHLGLLLQSSLKNISCLGHVQRLKHLLRKSFIRFEGINFLHCSEDAVVVASSSYMCVPSGGGIKSNSGDIRRSDMDSRRGSFSGRDWTNVLLVINVLVYIAQVVSQGKLTVWGAKVNSLIAKGQLWRLATSSFLHANIGHLMVNCYSLNSIGPTVESICGPRRYLAVYTSSAIASSAMSYWLCKAPAVGASGAIFGLVGSFAVFILRHRALVGGGKEDLQHIAHVIVLNMAIGLLSQRIDNWGHLGGLLGGVATSWLLGPAWRYESVSNNGRKVLADRAPIFSLINSKRTPP